MSKSFLLILLFLVAVSVNTFSQTYPSISKKEIYDFVQNNVVDGGGVILVQEPIKIKIADTTKIFMDSIFALKDHGFIKKQLNTQTLANWEPFKDVKLMKKSLNPVKYWDKSETVQQTYGGVVEISIPIFSLDKSKCMLIYHWSHGEAAQDISYYYYQKVNNKWEYIDKISHE